MSVFVHDQGIKTVNAGGGGQKMAKFCSVECPLSRGIICTSSKNPRLYVRCYGDLQKGLVHTRALQGSISFPSPESVPQLAMKVVR